MGLETKESSFAQDHRVINRHNMEFNLTSVFSMDHKLCFMHQLCHYYYYPVVWLGKVRVHSARDGPQKTVE